MKCIIAVKPPLDESISFSKIPKSQGPQARGNFTK